MIKLLDGRFKGSVLMLQRAPLYLRVVWDDNSGEVDGLDQLDDTPEGGEFIFVYERVGEVGWVFLRSGGRRHGACCQRVAMAEYRAVAVEGERFRETAAWREWCLERAKGRR